MVNSNEYAISRVESGQNYCSHHRVQAKKSTGARLPRNVQPWRFSYSLEVLLEASESRDSSFGGFGYCWIFTTVRNKELVDHVRAFLRPYEKTSIYAGFEGQSVRL
eukprot:6129793-Amphidinium_carterae.1